MDIRRSYLFWKISFVLPLGLIVLLAILIFSTRQLNQAVCLEVSGLVWPRQLTNTGRTSLMVRPWAIPSPTIFTIDVNYHRAAVDRRQRPLSFAISSPDKHYRLGFQASSYDTTTGDLILQKITSPSELPETTILQRNVTEEYREYSLISSVQWSPDSRHFAYLWHDGKQLMLTLMGLDGSHQQTLLSFSNAALGSWSADGLYFRVIKTTQNGNPESYEIWQSSPFQRVGDSSTVFSGGSWSPQGHQYVGIRKDSQGQEKVILWSPEDEVTLPSPPRQENSRNDTVYWSPDGAYIVLLSAQRCSESKACTNQRRFDLWDRKGKSIAQNIVGSIIPGNALTNGIYPENAAFSADGSKFVVIQTGVRNGKQVHDLVSISIADGTAQTIAADLVTDYLHRAFYVERKFYTAPMQGSSAKASSNRVLIITNHNDKINVELADLDGSHRSMIVENASELVVSPNNQVDNPFWTADGEWITIPWATRQGKQKESHLTWVRADGTGLQQVDGLYDLEQVSVIATRNRQQQTMSKSIGYLNSDGNSRQYTLAIHEFTQAQLQNVLNDVGWHDTWTVNVAPNNKTFAIVNGALNNTQLMFGSNRAEITFGAGGLTFNGGILSSVNSSFTSGIQLFNKLHLFSPNTAKVNHISSNVFGPTSWSPDGSMLAYLSFDTTTKKTYVNVVDAKGKAITGVSVQVDDQLTIQGWTKCR